MPAIHAHRLLISLILTAAGGLQADTALTPAQIAAIAIAAPATGRSSSALQRPRPTGQGNIRGGRRDHDDQQLIEAPTWDPSVQEQMKKRPTSEQAAIIANSSALPRPGSTGQGSSCNLACQYSAQRPNYQRPVYVAPPRGPSIEDPVLPIGDISIGGIGEDIVIDPVIPVETGDVPFDIGV